MSFDSYNRPHLVVQDLFFVVVVELNTEEIAALMTISLL